jgi:hypothetical protein
MHGPYNIKKYLVHVPAVLFEIFVFGPS